MKLINVLVAAVLSSTTLMAGSASTNKLLAQAKKEVAEIKASTLHKMIENEDAIIVLDIREEEQKIDGEIYAGEYYAITRGNLEFEIENNVKDKNIMIVTYCRAGNRGILAAKTLKDLGYKNAKSLKGGLRAWVQAGYPVETALGTFTLSKEEE